MDKKSAGAEGTGNGAQTPSTMRAIRQSGFGGPEVLTLDEMPVPEIAEGKLLVEVQSAGLDRGTWHVMAGLPLIARPMFGIRKPRNPVPGLDFAGRVAEVGARVSGFVVGDPVFGVASGSFAEYALADAKKISKRPANLTVDAAAVTPISGITALEAVTDRGEVAEGQRVLITGASGGVGSFAVQLAAAQGATVVGVASTSKLEFVRQLGAVDVIDYTAERLDHHGTAYDAIIDIAGNTAVGELRELMKPDGTLVIVGGETDGRWLGGIDRSLRAAVMSPFVKQTLRMFVASEASEQLDRLSEFIADGKLKPQVNHRVPLEDAPKAMQQMIDGELRGKAAIVVREGS